MDSSFYFYLPSNIEHKHIENKINHYFTPLPQNFQVNSTWEVALVELIIPYTWFNITENMTNILFHKIYFNTETDNIIKR
jgi:hypothetical protein